LRLPPGPRPKPIIGNLLDLPANHEWITYDQWARTYGDLVHVDVLGTHMIWVNSRELAYEIFERRSSIYSDRISFTMLNELVNSTWNFGLQRYGSWWRRHRRAMHTKFHSKAAEALHPIQIKHTRDLLQKLLHSPEKYTAHLLHTAGAMIMEVAYGIYIKHENDPYLVNAFKVVRSVDEAATPGRFLVDILPWLKYIPAWVPGAEFQRKAVIWRKFAQDLLDLPFQETKNRMSEGIADLSLVSSHLTDIATKPTNESDDELVIKNTAATMFAGGTDTTANTIQSFILAMILYPEVQKKAQKELDDVLGNQRLVEFGDMDSLPYVMAVCKEALRWHPLLPSGIGHMASEDDVIQGYFIPKGTVVLGNVWKILHNEADFGPETDKFNPERYFMPGIRDPATSGAFGFGRRICAGRFMALNSVFIAIDYHYRKIILYFN
ncbi:hypothetical protein M422DRAFT_195619, partial [Sphaerobolus stellatus SS14]